MLVCGRQAEEDARHAHDPAELIRADYTRFTGVAQRAGVKPVILDHIGAPLGVGPYADRRAEVFALWRSALVELSRCPNVAVKLGGLGMLFCGFGFHLNDTPPSSDELAAAWRPYIETCIDAFGPERCMFESNFPVDKQSCSYATVWNSFKKIAAGYSADEKAAMFFGTANRIYRLRIGMENGNSPRAPAGKSA